MVGAVAYPTPSIVAAIAAHPKNTIPCLIERSRSDVVTVRADAAAVLVQTLAQSKGGLDAEIRKVAMEAILNTLHDPSESVRLCVVGAVGGFGGEDMIPLLEEAAKADTGDDDGQRFLVRNAANEAIAEIEKRAATNSAIAPRR
jgi:HEAT repeat protein